MAPYRITRLCPGSWAIVNRLTGHSISNAATFEECMAIWEATYQFRSNVDALVRRADDAVSRLDATLAALKSNPVGRAA